jgi:hypothetical protein
VTITDDHYVEVLQGIGDCKLGSKSVDGARGRPGIYSVTVKKAGYRTTNLHGVELATDYQCETVSPKAIQLRLVPEKHN